MNDNNMIKSEYDRVFDDAQDQASIYEFCKSAILQVPSGFN
jgi:hypothetical protein